MIKETIEKIKQGRLKSARVVEESLKKARQGQSRYNSYITILDEKAMQRADYIDDCVKKGEDPGPLAGIPVAVKDNMLYRGTPMTCASEMLRNYISPYTATAVKKLLEAGAVIVAKTNMDEFAMGSSGETSAFGPVRNPIDTERIPGGSSSGSAAAVAAGEVMGALGSDTGGSVRQPASMCGVVGLKPTYGMVSRYGLSAFASSLDQIGPLTGKVEDAARILKVIAGFDQKDSTSVDIGVSDYVKDVDKGVDGLKVGIPKEYMGEGLSGEVRQRVENTAQKLERKGARIREISLKSAEYAVAVYYIIGPAEASANLARYDGIRYGLRPGNSKNLKEQYKKARKEGFGAEVKRRIMLGTYVLSSGYYDEYYSKAQRVRKLIKEDFDEAFSGVDLILSPTTPTTAFKLGEKSDDLIGMYMSDVYTVSCNLAGIPAISVPAGKDSAGLPIGCQLISPSFGEALLFRGARQIEKFYE